MALLLMGYGISISRQIWQLFPAAPNFATQLPAELIASRRLALRQLAIRINAFSVIAKLSLFADTRRESSANRKLNT
jgi:hypothetical protein